MRHSTFEPVRLDAYLVARQLVASVGTVSRRWSGWADLGDQARRAAVSVLLNLAEGAAQPPTSRNKRRHYDIALGSAVEVAAALDAASALGLPVADAPALAERTTRLIGGLVRRHR